MIGADESGVAVTWSRYVEAESELHLRSGAVAIGELRRRLDRELGPAGVDPDRFQATSAEDRQVLADVDASRASYLITEDVDDFDVAPATSIHAEPSVLFRGVRCVTCRSIVEAPMDLELGLCVDCRP